MRKFISFLSAVFFTWTAVSALPTSSILLQHQGRVTVFSPDSLSVALDCAVDGDTVLLSKGTFPGFTINKPITVRGEGQETWIQGDVTVAIPDSVTLNSTLIEGVWVKGYNKIVVTEPVNNLKIKQTEFYDISFERTVSDVTIDRCYCGGEVMISKHVMSLLAVASKIKRIKSLDVTTKEISVVNCNVKWFHEPENFRGAIINSIVGYDSGGWQVSLYGCSFINTLFCVYRTTIDRTCYWENSWETDDTKILSDYMNCKASDEELIEKGYLGNDGTVIGCNGSANPYSLILAVPTVEESDIKLDSEKRVLNVKIKLKGV